MKTDAIVRTPHARLEAALRAVLAQDPMFIPKDEVVRLQHEFDLSTPDLLHALVPLAREKAVPGVTGTKVGSAGIGESGNVYLGANIEVGGTDPHQNVHSEGFLVVNAMRHHETRILQAEVTCPCGHCRQLLNETVGGPDMQLTYSGKTRPLSELLDDPYGTDGSLLAPPHNPLGHVYDARVNDGKPLTEAALEAARQSYTRDHPLAAGLAFRLDDGSLATGSFLDVKGRNASMSPHLAALVDMVCQGKPFESIRHAILVEEKPSPYTHEGVTRSVLKSLAPWATLRVRHTVREGSTEHH